MDVRDVQRRLVTAGQSIEVDGVMGPRTHAALFAFVGMTGVTGDIVALGRAAPLYYPAAGLTTSLRLAHALARWAVETCGFTRCAESLNYSASGLMQTFGVRRITQAAANTLGRQPGEKTVPLDRQQAIANIVYGGRWGRDNLGNQRPGDGWLYRGRGLTQLTGYDNYAEAAHITGIDLVMHPEQAADPATGLRIACDYWTARHINEAADEDDAEEVCRRVNGGRNGLVDQLKYLTRAKVVLK